MILGLGGIGYFAFRLSGLESLPAGIASEAVLVLLVVGWTISYLVRVVTGNMTFIEQRRRYREVYEELTNSELSRLLEAMPENERNTLLAELENKKKISNSSADT